MLSHQSPPIKQFNLWAGGFLLPSGEDGTPSRVKNLGGNDAPVVRGNQVVYLPPGGNQDAVPVVHLDEEHAVVGSRMISGPGFWLTL